MNFTSGIETQARILLLKIVTDTQELDLTTNQAQLFVSASIYSSIFQSILRMSLVLTDTSDIIKNMKLKGNESVIIRFSKNAEDKIIELKFRINSFVNNGVKNTFDKKNILVLDCVSEEYLTGRYVLSKKLSGVGSSIISSLVTTNLQSLKVLTRDETKTRYDIQTNYRNSFDIIHYVAKNDNCFFYEELDGFYYKKFESLGTNSEVETISFFVNQSQMLSDDVPRAYKLDNFNNEILLEKGVLNSEFLNIGSTNYSLNRSNIKSSQLSSNFGNASFFQSLEGRKSNVSSVYGRVENRLKRYMEIFNLQSHVIQIKTNGKLDRRVGQKVTLNYQGHDNSQLDHELYKGDWVITAIKNHLVVGSYTQDIQLAKINFTK